MSLFSFYKMNVLFGRKKLNILVPQILILFTGTVPTGISMILIIVTF